MSNAIVPIDKDNAIQSVRVLAAIIRELRESVFVEGQDYGKIPGTGDKPVLLLPGMEKLLRALRLRPEYVERRATVDFDKPLFYFEIECRLYEVESGLCVSTAIGSTNSMEKKWAWRWIPLHEVPRNLDIATLESVGGRISEFAFAIDKAETSGKYGKPAEYWQQFKDAIANGSAVSVMKKTKAGQSQAWEIDGTMYRIPNPDVYDQVNTIIKIAQKRALASAIKGAANVSEFFTVDLEDIPQHQFPRPPIDAVEGEFVEVSPAPIPTAQAKQQLGNGTVHRTTRDLTAIYEATKTHFVVQDHFSNTYNKLTSTGAITDAMTDTQVIEAINANRAAEGKADKGWYQDGSAVKQLSAAIKTQHGLSLESALSVLSKKLSDFASPAALLEALEAVDVPF